MGKGKARVNVPGRYVLVTLWQVWHRCGHGYVQPQGGPGAPLAALWLPKLPDGPF